MSSAPVARARLEPCLPPSPPRPVPGLALPAGSCDSHMHVFGPPTRYALRPERSYTPAAAATLDDYRAVMRTYGIERAVLVQPSVYGTDNGLLLDALAAEPERLRGVAVVPPDLPAAELAILDRAGVRGVRINRRNPGGLPPAAIGDLGRRIAPFGWHVQLFLEIERVDVGELAEAAGLPVVVDHFGLLHPTLGTDALGFRRLLALLESGQGWVKLSAPHRVCGRLDGYEVLAPFVERLVAVRPDRLLWATDWPHTECYDAVPDDAGLLALMAEWLPAESLRRQVLVENPKQLYWSHA
jgi:2-pyrone-4,6-dicarboxylate lactonase